MGIFDDIQEGFEDVKETASETVDDAVDAVTGGGSDFQDSQQDDTSGSSEPETVESVQSDAPTVSAGLDKGTSPGLDDGGDGGSSGGGSSSGGGISGRSPVGDPTPDSRPEQQLPEGVDKPDSGGGSGGGSGGSQGGQDREPTLVKQELDKFGNVVDTEKAFTEAEAARMTSGGDGKIDAPGESPGFTTINPNAPESVQRAQREIQEQQAWINEARRNIEQSRFLEEIIRNRLERARTQFEPGQELQRGGETITREELIADLQGQLNQVNQGQERLSRFVTGSGAQNLEQLRQQEEKLQEAADNPLQNPRFQQENDTTGQQQREQLNLQDLPRDFDAPAPTDGITTQFASGTNIRGGFSRPLSDRELRQEIDRQAQVIGTLGRPEGWDFLAATALGNQDRAQEAIEEAGVEGIETGDPGALEFLSSPIGVATTAPLAGAAGQAALRGAQGISATAGTAARGGAILGATGFSTAKGFEAGTEAREGDTAGALGTGLQTFSELGGFGAGAEAVSRRFAPRLADTTVTEADLFLRQLDNQGENLVGGGQLEARTNILRPQIIGDTQVDEVAARADDLVVQQTSEGTSAAGTLSIRGLEDEAVEEAFAGTARPVASRGQDEVVTSDKFQLGDQDPQFGVSRSTIESRETTDGFVDIEFGSESTIEDGSRVLGGGRAVIDQSSVPGGGGSGSGAASSSGAGGGGGGNVLENLESQVDDAVGLFDEQVSSSLRSRIDTDPEPLLPGAAAAPVESGGQQETDTRDAGVFEAGFFEQQGQQVQGGQSQETVQARESPDTGASILGSPASTLEEGSGELVERDPILGTQDSQVEEPDTFEPPRSGIFESPREAQDEVVGQEQFPGQGQGLDQGVFQEAVPAQAQSSLLESQQAQAQEVRLAELSTPLLGQVSAPPGRFRGAPVPPGLPGFNLFGEGDGGSGGGDVEARDGGGFAPSLEGIVLGLESDIEPGENPTLTGLEPRGVPDFDNQGSEDRSQEEQRETGDFLDIF